MEDDELFGERHEQEEYGLYGRKHAELCDLHNVSNSVCLNCGDAVPKSNTICSPCYLAKAHK
jgi:predicted amidophosphoribosyltransferase